MVIYFQFSSVTQLCPTVCNPKDCSMPGLPVHHQLPEPAQTHVHWVGDGIQPSKLYHPLLLLPSIFSSIRVFSMSQFFASGGQSTGASASGSVLPRNNQDWFTLWLTGLNILNIPWKDRRWSWSTNTLANWCEEPTHWKRPWCWEGLKEGGERDDRRWDGWMALPTQWTEVWANPGR